MVPFCHCPFKNIEKDCPFACFWNTEELEEHIKQINILSEEKLDELRKHHRNCLLSKIKKGEVIIRS